MSLRCYRLFALLMALLWVPATAHCRLENVGLLLDGCAGSCTEQAADTEHADSCDVLENGFYKTNLSPLKIAPVAVAIGAGYFYSLALEPDAALRQAIVAAPPGPPPDWIPDWPFERRAAAPAHAPDSLIA
jgi:hypothetical protein